MSNRSSFLDHFILELIVFAARGDKAYFLTKHEAFAAPLERHWHNSVGAIAVDCGNPSTTTLRRIAGRRAITSAGCSASQIRTNVVSPTGECRLKAGRRIVRETPECLSRVLKFG